MLGSFGCWCCCVDVVLVGSHVWVGLLFIGLSLLVRLFGGAVFVSMKV